MAKTDVNLTAVAAAMVAPGKGILAIDESTGTCNKRFEALGIPPTAQARQAYRELLLTAPGLGEFVSGAILYDETIRQSAADGVPFVRAMERQGILPGIKVDTGTIALAGAPCEKITEGLDGLAKRVEEYRALGARFAKWRAVITIDDSMPTDRCIEANAHVLARYARTCQDGGLVPIVEPEVLMDGIHGIARCADVTERTLRMVFAQLAEARVQLEAMILKPSMVIAGSDCPAQSKAGVVATATVTCLRHTVPAAVAGIAFLSGGQDDIRATEHLNAMNRSSLSRPWPLTFSYGRALQAPALDFWRGSPERVSEAQRRLLHRARCNSAAALGTYDASLEAGAREQVPA